jgi:hypothetical protein
MALRSNNFSYITTDHKGLTWQMITAEIDAGRPFLASWHYNGGGGHMFVVIGYSVSGNEKKVVIHDPLSPEDGGLGESYPITLSQFENGAESGETHWNDYYNIAKKPAGS